MDVVLTLIAAAAGAWGIARIARAAIRVVAANRLRGRELRSAVHTSEMPSAVCRAALERADAEASLALQEDYGLTGAILAALGAAAMFWGRATAYGGMAVGLYSAGTIAIIGGIGLAVLSAVLRLLARPVLDPPSRDRGAA